MLRSRAKRDRRRRRTRYLQCANEIAVAAFLACRIPFLAIPRVVEQTLDHIANSNHPTSMLSSPRP